VQDRWSAVTTSVILGSVWAAWHVVPDIQQGHSATWNAWKMLEAVASRVLIVWLYNNTATSAFTAILTHDMYNVSWSLFPNTGSDYDPAIGGSIIAIAAVLVTFLGGSETLARYRYAA
jgi:CAAX protease family protein